MEEYQALFMKNMRIEGFGTDVTQVAPCPFCAAPGWARWRILFVQQDMGANCTCAHCGRSAKFLFEDSTDNIRFELVQTGGPPIADYLPPVRRIDN
jgi:hypothetical protein